MFRGSLRKSVIPRGKDCEMTANPEETMESFIAETKKALWHVYDMLKSTNADNVHISQLKVITSNIGRTMGFDSSESLLDKDGMTSMDFETYFDIVKTELILKQKTNSDCTLKPLGERLSDVIKTCWTYCRYERTHKSKALGTDQCLVLWRLFNFFCETNTDGEIVLPVLLHRDEAAFICKEFIEITGQRNKENSVSVVADVPEDGSECVKFGEFQNLFEKHFLEGLSPNAVTYGLTELYEKFILEVLAKGMMSKRGFNVKTWKERWLVLTPKDLKYFVNQSQKHLKGTIEFDKDCEIEVPPERAAHKPYRLILHTSKKPYEMSATDLKTKHEWVSALQTALDHVGKATNIHQEAARIRCLARLEKKRLSAEEARRRKEDAELLEARQKELDEERRKRQEEAELRQKELDEEKRKHQEEAERRQKELDEEKRRRLEEAERRQKELDEEKRMRLEEAELLAARQKELDEEKRQRQEEAELRQRELDEEKRKRQEEATLRQKELDEEKKRREEAEAKAREEQLLREAEQERLKQLEAINQELERLLAEERQAKKDEEIVRNLQSKLLEEEFQKREELERLKQQQEEMLREEREQKASLQSDREEQERLLREAKEKLEQLERDKVAAADKMQEAQEKLKKAEKDRKIMEDKANLWKKPVGLRRPLEPKVDPLVTHRGYGAFCDMDFHRRPEETVEVKTNVADKDITEKAVSETEPKDIKVEKEDENKNESENESKTEISDTTEKNDSEAKSSTELSKNIDLEKDINGEATSAIEAKKDHIALEPNGDKEFVKDKEGGIGTPDEEFNKDLQTVRETKKNNESQMKYENPGHPRSCIDSGVISDNGEFEACNEAEISAGNINSNEEMIINSKIHADENSLKNDDDANAKEIAEKYVDQQVVWGTEHEITEDDCKANSAETSAFGVNDKDEVSVEEMSKEINSETTIVSSEAPVTVNAVIDADANKKCVESGITNDQLEVKENLKNGDLILDNKDGELLNKNQ